MRGDLTEDAQSIGLVAPFPVNARQLEGACGTLGGVVQPAGQPMALAEMDEPEGRAGHVLHGGGLLHRLLQERQALGQPAGLGIRKPQGRGQPRKEQRELCGLAEAQAAFEHGDDLRQGPVPEIRQASAATSEDQAPGATERLGLPDAFLPTGNRFDKLA